mmetsp:Transcript_59556/g.98754  ORF Transcript_59556/g.98754 Transcript_59556/m.98754 type:complete len:231 (-) Transcript_59556:236-928(-)
MDGVLDLVRGFSTGFILIAGIFIAEWRLGWLAVVGVFETSAPGERFSLNLLFDVIFHIAVSVSEELPLRGWLLLNTAEASVLYLGSPAGASMCIAMLAESLIFASLHMFSPGATRVGLCNLVIGGCAAAINVAVSGGLAFPLGWHFGWNITMGNVFGLSTSGIPIASTVVAVVPHPQKAHLHGGTFGPEQGLLAVPAYLAGALIVLQIYGFGRCSSMSFAIDFPLLHASS